MGEIKYNWGIVSKDYNSPFLRNYIFSSSFLNYPKIIGVPVLLCGAVSHEDQIEYLYNPKNWQLCHEAIKAKVLKDPKFLNYLIDKSHAWGEAMNKWSERALFKANLAKASNSQLVKLLKEFNRRQAMGYTYGTSVALLDFQDFSFIDGSLKKFLESKVSGKQYENYYQLFTTPLNNSFAQDQEEALLALMAKFYTNKKWLKDVKSKKLEYLKNKYPIFYKSLLKHTDKYAWIYFVYRGPLFQPEQFLEFIRDYLLKGINPKKYLLELKKKKARVFQQRKTAIAKLKPDKFNALIIEYAPKIIWAKPRRKDYQSKSYYHASKLMAEISKRLSIAPNQARCLTPEALRAALKKNSADLKNLNDIYRFHICYTDPNAKKVIVLYGRAAKSFDRKIEREHQKKSQIKELTGTPTFPGMVKGHVKIIYRPEDMHKMKRGDILVSNATTPSIVQAMKMSGAVVTDEGGLTCHAAIVSRELQIPCIIGTKIATEIFKDGDMVEVDATKGVIRKVL